jgi:hypothetical protein
MIAERRAVWIAQSDLFLDTDVRLSFAYIARVAAASKYTLEELEAICRDEVAPIVESNLLQVAGEWAGFPDEWLVESIVSRLERKPWLPHVMLTDVMSDWRAVAHLAARLRALPPEQREARSRLWDSMSKLFLDSNPPPPADLPRDPELLEWIFRHEVLPAYGGRGGDFEASWLVWLTAAKNPK